MMTHAQRSLAFEAATSLNGEYRYCQACGEEIASGEDMLLGEDACLCEDCHQSLLGKADMWAVEHCRILDPEACCRDGLSDDQRFRETNYLYLLDQFDGTSLRGIIYRQMIEQRMIELIEVLLQEYDLNSPSRPWLDEGF